MYFSDTWNNTKVHGNDINQMNELQFSKDYQYYKSPASTFINLGNKKFWKKTKEIPSVQQNIPCYQIILHQLG